MYLLNKAQLLNLYVLLGDGAKVIAFDSLSNFIDLKLSTPLPYFVES